MSVVGCRKRLAHAETRRSRRKAGSTGLLWERTLSAMASLHRGRQVSVAGVGVGKSLLTRRPRRNAGSTRLLWERTLSAMAGRHRGRQVSVAGVGVGKSLLTRRRGSRGEEHELPWLPVGVPVAPGGALIRASNRGRGRGAGNPRRGTVRSCVEVGPLSLFGCVYQWVTTCLVRADSVREGGSTRHVARCAANVTYESRLIQPFSAASA